MRQNHPTVPATQIKNSFGECLAHVRQHAEPLYIEKHGRVVAVLVDIGTWETITNKKESHMSAWIREAREIAEEIRKTGKRQTPAVELVRQLRDELSNDT